MSNPIIRFYLAEGKLISKVPGFRRLGEYIIRTVSAHRKFFTVYGVFEALAVTAWVTSKVDKFLTARVANKIVREAQEAGRI